MDVDYRGHLVRERGFRALDNGDLLPSLGRAETMDAVGVSGLVCLALIGGFRVPQLGVDLSWTEPCLQ